MLEIKNIVKKYGSKVIIDNLQASFSETGVSLLVGINGSGKTTLFHMLSNLIEPDNGTITIDNYKYASKEYKSVLFYMPSDFFLPEYMTGQEYASFILSHYQHSNRPLFDAIIGLLQLDKEIHNTIETYSFGMKKKLQVALAISSNAKYILLDEIFNGLDFETTILIQEIFKELAKDRKLIIISHDSNTLNTFYEDIRLLQRGQLTPYTGSPQELYNLIIKEGEIHEKLQEYKKYI